MAKVNKEEILAEQAVDSSGMPSVIQVSGAEISVADRVFVKGTVEAEKWAEEKGLDWRPMKEGGQFRRVQIQAAAMVVTVEDGNTDISVWYLVKGEDNKIAPVPVELLQAVG